MLKKILIYLCESEQSQNYFELGFACPMGFSWEASPPLSYVSWMTSLMLSREFAL